MSRNGTYICYEPRNFQTETLRMIERANALIEQYEAQGLTLSVRQIHYQFVARDWYENTQANYDKLSNALSNGRMAGLVSWTAIEDRNRYLQGVEFFSHPNEALRAATDHYKSDLWADQDWRPEFRVEKAALEGIVSQIALSLRVNFLALRGYNSASESWRGGQRMAGYIQKGQRPIIFHIGDLDPSGWHMTIDERRRTELFAGYPIPVMRLALNMDQVEQYKPPPNFSKETDSRTPEFRRMFGDKCYEADALEPLVLQQLMTDAVLKIRDQAKWDAAVAQEVDDRRYMEAIIETTEVTSPDSEEEPR